MTLEDLRVLPVRDDQWAVVGRLWQAYRNDMAHVISASFPYPDGRYNHRQLDAHVGSADHAGHIAWARHPQVGEPAPVGFALIRGLTGERRAISGFWVAPAARRTGLGRALALQVIAAYEGPWEIAFQEDNVGAGHFWRRVATEAWGEAWVESAEPVPGRPDVPPDHWIRTRGCP